MGGAAPARSALTLRLVLASFGFVVCAVGALLLVISGHGYALAAVLGLLALIALIDLVVVIGRKRRGDPG
jgi:hypothetical protein